MTSNLLQAAIVVLAATSLFLLGRKRREGWLVALANEGVWLGYAYTLRSWGMVVLAVMYGTLHVRNFYLWNPCRDSAH